MGIVQQKSGNTGAAAAPTTFNATLDAATVAGSGRYLVIVVACDNVVPTPSGFTLDEDQVNNAGHYVFRKSAVDSETSWAIAPGSGGGAAAWWALELSQLDPSSPLDANAHTSQGTGASGNTWSTGTTGTPTQDDLLMIASYSASVSGETDINATGFSNDYVEQIDEFTTKSSGTDIGLYGAVKTISAAAAQECTVTLDASAARTGIMVGYKLTAGGTTTPISLSGSVAPAGSVSRQTSKPLAGSTTPTGAMLRQTIKTLAGATGPAGALTRSITKALAGAVTPTGTLVRQPGKALTGAVTPTGAVSRLVGKTLAGTVSPAGVVLKVLGRLLGGSISPAGALATSVVEPVVGGSMSHADRSAASASHTARTGPTMTGR